MPLLCQVKLVKYTNESKQRWQINEIHGYQTVRGPCVWSIHRFLDGLLVCNPGRSWEEEAPSFKQTSFSKDQMCLPPSLFFSSLPMLHTFPSHLNTECTQSRAKQTVENRFPWIFIFNNIWKTPARRSSCKVGLMLRAGRARRSHNLSFECV